MLLDSPVAGAGADGGGGGAAARPVAPPPPPPHAPKVVAAKNTIADLLSIARNSAPAPGRKAGCRMARKSQRPMKNGPQLSRAAARWSFLRLVGVAGFELATPCTPCKCATRLRYTPTSRRL